MKYLLFDVDTRICFITHQYVLINVVLVTSNLIYLTDLLIFFAASMSKLLLLSTCFC